MAGVCPRLAPRRRYVNNSFLSKFEFLMRNGKVGWGVPRAGAAQVVVEDKK